jgi:hypothetical protein
MAVPNLASASANSSRAGLRQDRRTREPPPGGVQFALPLRHQSRCCREVAAPHRELRLGARHGVARLLFPGQRLGLFRVQSAGIHAGEYLASHPPGASSVPCAPDVPWFLTMGAG